MKPNDEFAFPAKLMPPQTGMTLRDYFAAHAMQGLIARNKFTVGMNEPRESEQAAAQAYGYADRMLAVRNNP